MTRAMVGRMSSTAYAPAIRSENWDSTSYGVARSPYTSRSASRRAHARTGWNAQRDHGRSHHSDRKVPALLDADPTPDHDQPT